MSDQPAWLENTASFLPHLQGKQLSLEYYDSWMSRITTLSGAESVTAAVALRNLKGLSEDAMKHIFATGCMVIPGRPSTIDIHSDNHVKQHFYGGPLKKFLRALKEAKTQLHTC